MRNRQKFAGQERRKKQGMDASNSKSMSNSMTQPGPNKAFGKASFLPKMKVEGGAAQTLQKTLNVLNTKLKDTGLEH